LTEKEEEIENIAFNKDLESPHTENSNEEQTKATGFDEIIKLSEEEERIENLNSIKELESPHN